MTSVIIAARNEQVLLGNALRVLPTDVSVCVVANDCTDATAEVARGYGAEVVELEEQGKMPAIQAGLRHIGRRALEPVLLLDADSVPVFPKGWSTVMTGVLSGPEVATMAGPIRYTGKNHFASPLRSTALYGRQLRNRLGYGRRYSYGINMGVHTRTQDRLDALLNMPHFWPGEDKAIVDLMLREGGTFVQCVNPLAIVSASDRYHISFAERMRLGREETRKQLRASYLARAAEGSTPYDDYYLHLPAERVLVTSS